MRILITQDTDWLERNPGQQHHLADRLSVRGHEIRVIDYDILWKTRKSKGWRSARQVFARISKTVPDADVNVIRPAVWRIPLFHYVSMFFSYRKEIKKQLVDFKPDIIVGHSVLSNYLSMRLSRRAGIPYVFHMTDAQHTIVPSRILRFIAKHVEKRILKNANRIIVINERLRDYSVGLGADPNNVVVIRAGIDLARYDPNISGRQARKELGIDDDDFVLFFMGWLYDFSGLKEVAEEVLRRDSKLRLLIVGDGDAFDDLQEIRERSGRRDQVILTGKQPFERIPELIATADVCLLPAYNNETMRDIVPIKLYEYMAMGKPVISTELPGVMREFGRGNGVTYVAEPRLVLDKAVELADSGAMPLEGKKARGFVQGRDWEKVVDDFEMILEEVRNGRIRRSYG
ncbi:MAG TPA: glycosyltransferase family 4 protein [Thermoplasmata archaeon]